MASDLPQNGEFNVISMIQLENAGDLEPSKKKYTAFMEKWGKENRNESQKNSAKYPEVRTLTGEYRMREIMLK